VKFAGDTFKSAAEYCADCVDQLSRLINVKRISIDGSTQLQVQAENTQRVQTWHNVIWFPVRDTKLYLCCIIFLHYTLYMYTVLPYGGVIKNKE